MAHVRIGTRKSPLALWQAEYVAAQLHQRDPGVTVELVKMSTRGDRILDAPLARVGGKGLFVKEIEEALLDGRVDLAVHSLKDMPADLPDGLVMAAHPPRADPRDAWVSSVAPNVAAVKHGGTVGTASLRRQAQVLAVRPDLHVVPIRGSVETRLSKLETDGLDAIVLAAAGLERLGLAGRIAHRLEPEEMLPAVGQGVLALQARAGDDAILERLAALDDESANLAACCERAMLGRLGGGCQVPIAGHAVRDGTGWWLRGLVASPDGKVMVTAQERITTSTLEDVMALGNRVARELLERGAAPILAELGMTPG